MDFSHLAAGGVAEGVATVARGLLAHGVTAFCPTVISAASDYYRAVSVCIQSCKNEPFPPPFLARYCLS